MTVKLTRAYGGVAAGGLYDGTADDELALVNAGNASWDQRSFGSSGGPGDASGGGGSGTGVNDDYTAAQLAAKALAGTLAAGSIYFASDTHAFYGAPTVDSLDPLGGTVYVQESATAFAIATAALTAIGTGGQFDVRGYSTLCLSYKNAHSTSLSAFDISIKQGSGAWDVTHSAASDFANGDDLLIDVTTDDTDLDVTTLTNAKTAVLRLDVRGIDYVRVRAKQATSDGTCDWYSTKE